MFNGNTSSDFATLEDLLDSTDYYMRACGFVHTARIAYENFHIATFGDDPEGQYRLLVGRSRSFLDALLAYHEDARPLLDEAIAEIERMARADQRPYRKAKIDGELRRIVFERDAYRCRHCGGWKDLAVDHIFPERFGGTLDLANLQTLCRSCNSKKGTSIERKADTPAAD